MKCKYCGSIHIQMNGNRNGKQGYKCMDCNKRFVEGVFVPKFIKHFNVNIKIKDTNKLTRDNYCSPTNEIAYKEKQKIKDVSRFIELNGRPPGLVSSCYFDIPNEIFIDNEHYTNEYVKNHYEDCMKNYDLNMDYFNNLNWNEFNDYLLTFVKRNRLNEVKDLNELKNISGVYLLVLDEYKQVYIGKSDCLKTEIMKHWSKKKEFDYLIFGKVSESILSIDSFGALDTTRIFYKCPRSNIDGYEEKLEKNFDGRFKLNRIRGGLNAENSTAIRNLGILSSIHKRPL